MSGPFTPTWETVGPDTLREALGHAMAALRCLADYADPEEILDDPEDFGGPDDPVETLSMAYDNMKYAAQRAVARVEEVIAKARGECRDEGDML
jgi:hypothetical protein